MKKKSRNSEWLLSLVIVAFVFMSAPVVLAQSEGSEPELDVAVTVEPIEVIDADVVEPAVDKDSISLDFKDADIKTVLRVLSMKSGVNIVTGPTVEGLVTVRLEDVPWQKALEVILRTYDYVYERDENIIRVTTRDQMDLEPVETKTFILDYSKAVEVEGAIVDVLSERGRVKVAERMNMLVVTDIPTRLYQIGEVIKKLDQATPQAYIDSKVVRTEAGRADNMGIQWNPQMSLVGASRPTTFPFPSADNGFPASLKQFFPVASANVFNPNDARAFPNIDPTVGTAGTTTVTAPTFNYGTLDFSQFQATLQMLQSYTNTKIVSNPRVVVLNNQTANIQVGSDYPIPKFERNEQTGSMQVDGYDYRELGVVLNVTPHINSAEEILVDLRPEISSAGPIITFISGPGGLTAPSFNVTKAETQVLIQSGQTIAIGGLMTDSNTMGEDKVPYLADIPLIGKLFRSKRQAAGDNNAKIETLFFVTVTMVDSEGQPAGKRVRERNQKKGAQGSAQAMDNRASGSMTASQIEAPNVERTSPEKP